MIDMQPGPSTNLKGARISWSQAAAWALGLLTLGFIVFDVVSRRLSTPNRTLLVVGQFFQTVVLADALPAFIVLVVLGLLVWLAVKRPALRSTALLWGGALLVFSVIWLVYTASAYFINIHWWTPLKSYFPDLAAAFLHGRTYLEKPDALVDLTLFNGHWYVSFPPLAALMMLPQAAWEGADSINTVYFTIFWGAVSGALIFLILEKAARLGWTKLGSADHFWLAGLFAFGTVHWYMALTGQVWYISQILTVTFSALAVWLALQNWPALSVGAALGVAMLARPNVVFLWPFLFAIFYQLNRLDRSTLFQKRMLRWVILSALPVLAAAASLLWYNDLRFGSPLDFGYANMNVGDYLKPDLQTYGQFNVHYLLRNLGTFFFSLPYWDSACGFFGASEMGLSVLITTPVLIYLYRAFRKDQPWVWGAWASVLLLFLLIMLYFNTGSLQFGYRFLMDLIVPLMLLLALAAGERLSLMFKILILCGVLVNYYGVLWFFAGYCH